MLTGLERRRHHGQMRAGRRADIDDVDVVHGQQIVEIDNAALDAEFVADLVEPFLVQIAERQNLELVGIGQIALDDMRAADAAANDGDVEDAAHCCHSVPFSAMACAVSAIFIAL
jgi:hypothetical protein